jgi:hypothetical protein
MGIPKKLTVQKNDEWNFRVAVTPFTRILTLAAVVEVGPVLVGPPGFSGSRVDIATTVITLSSVGFPKLHEVLAVPKSDVLTNLNTGV